MAMYLGKANSKSDDRNKQKMYLQIKWLIISPINHCDYFDQICLVTWSHASLIIRINWAYWQHFCWFTVQPSTWRLADKSELHNSQVKNDYNAHQTPIESIYCIRHEKKKMQAMCLPFVYFASVRFKIREKKGWHCQYFYESYWCLRKIHIISMRASTHKLLAWMWKAKRKKTGKFYWIVVHENVNQTMKNA